MYFLDPDPPSPHYPRDHVPLLGTPPPPGTRADTTPAPKESGTDLS